MDAEKIRRLELIRKEHFKLMAGGESFIPPNVVRAVERGDLFIPEISEPQPPRSYHKAREEVDVYKTLFRIR